MTRLIIGAMVRAIGAYPSGWRYPGAHRDPRGDAAVLRRAAEVAEAARLDYLFFGDWLATGHDLEFRDPYLVARVDPISAITYLAGVTERIGLIATANTSYADPYTLARATASVDLLSGGRAGLNLVTGAEPRARRQPRPRLPGRERGALRPGRRVRAGAAPSLGLVRRRCDRRGCRVRRVPRTRRACTPPTSTARTSASPDR